METQDVFFWRLAGRSAPTGLAYYPLDRVLTYKNLIYLLNLQINLDRMFTNFIWSDRKHLISKSVLIQPIEFGSLKMVTAKNILDTSKIMWIKRLSNNIDATWKILAKNLMGLDIKNILKKQMYSAIKSNIKTPWFRFLTTNIQNIKEFVNEDRKEV